MKKLIAILLCLALLILPGCGDKQEMQEFYLLLTPMEADLENAPNVVVESEEPSCNLAGWTVGDDVWWDMILPHKDTYTIRFWYSMPSDYEPCMAWLSMIPLEGDLVDAEPVFVPTSANGGWETYDYLDVTMDLPAGDVSLSLETLELPEGQEYFINLRAVEIFNGELAPVEPGIMDDTPVAPRETDPEMDPDMEPDMDPETEPGLETEADGSWWVVSGGMPGNGMGLADAMFVNAETWTCDLYNAYGDQTDSWPCTVEDDQLIVETGDFGDIAYLIEGDYLIDPDYGSVEFEWVTEPEFQFRPDLDGTWYRCGDPENPSIYEIADGRYQKLLLADGDPVVEDEAEYTYGTISHYVNDLVIEDVPHLLSEGSVDIYPVFDGAAFFEEGDDGYKAYVAEDACDPEYIWAWMAVEDLMNSGALGTASDGTELLLHFEGFGFYVTVFAPNGERLDEAPYGDWWLRHDGFMELETTEGDWIEFPIPEPGDTILFPYQGENVELTVAHRG